MRGGFGVWLGGELGLPLVENLMEKVERVVLVEGSYDAISWKTCSTSLYSIKSAYFCLLPPTSLVEILFLKHI